MQQTQVIFLFILLGIFCVQNLIYLYCYLTLAKKFNHLLIHFSSSLGGISKTLLENKETLARMQNDVQWIFSNTAFDLPQSLKSKKNKP